MASDAHAHNVELQPVAVSKIRLNNNKLAPYGTGGRTFKTHFIRSTSRSRPKNLVVD